MLYLLDCDDFKTFRAPTIISIFQLALNNLGLFNVYLRKLEKINNEKYRE